MNRIRGKVPQFSVITVRAATTTDVDTPEVYLLYRLENRRPQSPQCRL